MKKWLKRYVKVSVVLYVIYAFVGVLGEWYTRKHPLKNKDHQFFARLLFTTMEYVVLSPVYAVESMVKTIKEMRKISKSLKEER